MRISDWSSDVCSSDLLFRPSAFAPAPSAVAPSASANAPSPSDVLLWPLDHAFQPIAVAYSPVAHAPLPNAAEPVPLASVEISPKRSEEHTSEIQSLMRISYAVFCLKKKNITLVCIIHFYTNT